MTTTRYVIKRKSDGMYLHKFSGWTTDIDDADLKKIRRYDDDHLECIPVRVTIEEVKA